MTKFYIQYKNNSPVSVFTQYLHVPEGKEPDISDLVAAIAVEPTRRLAGIPADYGPLTLHFVVDGVEMTYNSWEPITVLKTNGTVGSSPLIIKSKSDVESDADDTMFSNPNQIPMTATGLLEWLSGSNNSSTVDLADKQILSQQQTNPNQKVVFPLVGREKSLQHIASCFMATYRHRSNIDRNSRRIPVCTGMPGLGRTRLMTECSTTVLDMTGIQGKRLLAIVSFGNDGNSYGEIDKLLGIKCSFAWRVLHSFFKAQYKFDVWMREKSPKNRKRFTMQLALSTIELYWSQKTQDNILLFVGVDKYRKLCQDELGSLLDILCDSSYCSTTSRLTFFCMLAGADLNMIRIARTSHPNIERIPTRFLTHMESMEAIGPFISNTHCGFVVSEAFARNVFHLSGVPRLLTKFAEEVVFMKLADLNEHNFQEARMTALSNSQHHQLSLADILKLLAISFTNTPVTYLLDCPFSESSLPYSRNLTWNQMVRHGMCQIQDDGQVIVPFHIIVQALKRSLNESVGLNQFETALLSSLNGLSLDVEYPLSNMTRWSSWEYFGASFYCIRINSFLVLGISILSLSDILCGSRFDSGIFNTQVHIRIAKVFRSNEQYGPDMPRMITRKDTSYYSVDWVGGETLQIVLNGENGPGVDIYFILKCAEQDSGYIIVLDQRKRLGSDITNSDLTTFRSKLPNPPACLNKFKLDSVFGLMSIYSQINISPVPDSTYFVSASDSLCFHGSLSGHPGCSMAIDANSALKISIKQIFCGTNHEQTDLANKVIE
ncbi:hypothetical protein BATDEDRAFT_25057 [Batrachochytrium dendrobatidis JAM81]|uniref:Crinkler (CRN) family protein n=1 Tax=Batrachochytrium dendrobatidis (strain JAM81 / FGSC 10211) TaxID=684364 RepID=F4P3K4_BATDJ|nr:uncharacterized protein BATDEDRAFT_25057 [Batrachochytrium dendrobatidis JAM81]EGF80212.1 hypothetical protein BATDEDRAFT_25057 [Batrachochytrium dendrobatidis JAM81]|eukprot:XP_006679003.1 hypothetical protein BATDEDRAFT_25057 [Batrachochytrium dendrobatidis JAM81]